MIYPVRPGTKSAGHDYRNGDGAAVRALGLRGDVGIELFQRVPLLAPVVKTSSQRADARDPMSS
jgi:hypothetical protein